MSNISDEKNVKVHVTAASGVVVKEIDGQKYVLLIKRAKDDFFPNHYEYPRGKCDKTPNEKTINCVVREVKEETGLDIIPIKLIDKFEYLADGGTRKTTCYNYLCKMKDENQKVKLSHEHQNHRWISQLGEAKIMILPDQVRTLEKVLNKENQISNTPENPFTKNNTIEEYLRYLS